MIIVRYLIRETLKSQIAILLILLLIFFCQKLIRVLEAAVNGDLPTNLILSVLGLGVPEMAQLILPLSLYLAILMTYGKLYSESEVTVMHACGFGKRGLVWAGGALALLTAIVAMVNVAWLTPWSSKYQDTIVAEAKANPNLASLMEGQFQTSNDGNMVMFIKDVDKQQLHGVFLAQLRPTGSQRPSVIVANQGHIERKKDGSQTIFLHQGTRYEGTAFLRDFRITHFTQFQAEVGYKNIELEENAEVDQASLTALWQSDSPRAHAEFHWRLTLVVSVFIMALLVIPLSEVNPRQGRVVSMLPAILLYLIYFLLQSSFKANGGKGKLDPALWIWGTNLFYFILALLLNSWDSLAMRRIRAKLKRAV